MELLVLKVFFYFLMNKKGHQLLLFICTSFFAPSFYFLHSITLFHTQSDQILEQQKFQLSSKCFWSPCFTPSSEGAFWIQINLFRAQNIFYPKVEFPRSSVRYSRERKNISNLSKEQNDPISFLCSSTVHSATTCLRFGSPWTREAERTSRERSRFKLPGSYTQKDQFSQG